MAGPPGSTPVFHRALMNALAAPPGDKLRPTDGQLVGMSWRLARESGSAELTPPLAQGYHADGRLDDLRLPQPIPQGAGQAAQAFLLEHCITPPARPWYAIAAKIEDTGLSGELGLPNSSQPDCRLCVLCVRRAADASVGMGAAEGFITQTRSTGKGGHLQTKAHKRYKEEHARRQEATRRASQEAAANARAKAY
jgi:hypothetical protein